MRDGFGGPIYANSATRDLCNYLLPDSAHLQEEDARFVGKKGYSQHKPPLPLYTVEEAQKTLGRFQVIPRSDPFTISPQLVVRPYDAGHILGSSSLELTITENGKSAIVVFSGDIGRYSQPILNDPRTPPRADYLLCESTYGDRDHPSDPKYDLLAGAITRTVQRGGVIVIPAFAVGRTQTLMYVLRQLEDEQRIPKLPVYVDSPMAINVTELYVSHREDHSVDFARQEQEGDRDPLNMRDVHLTRTVEESKQINNMKSPCIIISASGMATGGRILHHLAARLPDARNTVLLVGYQAQGTRGRALLDHAPTVRIHNVQVPVRAEIVELAGFSAHGDRNELARWLGGFAAPPRHLFLTHGEIPAMQAFQAKIEASLHWQISQPKFGESFDLAP